MLPKYKHDCDQCHFVGNISYPGPLSDGSAPLTNADLYYCERAESDMGGSVIARHSSDGPDYASAPVSIIKSHYLTMEQFSTSGPALIAGYYFTKAKGLIK